MTFQAQRWANVPQGVCSHGTPPDVGACMWAGCIHALLSLAMRRLLRMAGPTMMVLVRSAEKGGGMWRHTRCRVGSLYAGGKCVASPWHHVLGPPPPPPSPANNKVLQQYGPNRSVHGTRRWTPNSLTSPTGYQINSGTKKIRSGQEWSLDQAFIGRRAAGGGGGGCNCPSTCLG